MATNGIKVNMAPSPPGDFIRTEVIEELGLNMTKASQILEVRRNSKEVFDIDVFTAPEQKGGSNKKKLEWFASLLRVRNKTSHPERGGVTEEEYETIRKLDAWLFPRLDKNT